MNRDDLLVMVRAGAIAVLIVLIAFVAAARADNTPKLPPGVTCETVKALVAEHGRF